MKIVFLGSGPFAVPILERLHALSASYPLLRVVTRPDRPQERGRKLAPTPVRARAAELGVPCDAPESANDPGHLESLERLAPDLAIVADYGEMLRKRFRAVPRIGVFNLHASLLPRHRGAAPVVHALLSGDVETGVTLFRIEKELDAGPVVDLARLEVYPLETAGELEARLARLAADLLERTLPAFAAGTCRETPQESALASFAPKVEKHMGAIDWNASARDVANRVRAFNPWPGAYSSLIQRGDDTSAPGSRRDRAERTVLLRARAEERLPDEGDLSPGSVTRVRKDGFRVQCGSGAIEVLEIQRQGKAALDSAAYLRGKPLERGDRFVPREAAT